MALFVVGCVSYRGLVVSSESDRWVRHTHEVLENLQDLRAAMEAVLAGKPTPVTGIDGRVPVVMALAARKSYDEHRPVKLAEVSA